MKFFRPKRGHTASAGAAAAKSASVGLDLESAPNDPIVAVKTAVVEPNERSAWLLRSTLGSLPPAGLAGFSNRMRAGRVSGFDDMTVDEARGLMKAHSDVVPVAAALSMHRNGYIRQLSLKELGGGADPLVVPFLLLRVGEWNGAIRTDAIAAFDSWVHVDHTVELVRSYPLLRGARFSAGQRGRDIPDRIEQILRSPGALPILLRCIDQIDTETSRTATAKAVDHGATVELLERALATEDVVSIGLVTRSLATEGEINRQTGELLSEHPTARVRQEGVFRLLKHGGRQAEDVAMRALNDRSASVRATAQNWLKSKDRDVVQHYRSLSVDNRLAALLGLGDFPDKSDADFARNNLNGSPVVRRAALRLVAALGLSEDRALFVEVMLTGSGRERRSAISWFRRTGADPDLIDRMWDFPTDDGGEAKLGLITQLAPMTPVWYRIELALRAIRTEDPKLQRAGASLLSNVAFGSTSYIARPTPERYTKLRATFEALQPDLQSNLAHMYRWSARDTATRIDQILVTCLAPR